MRFPITDRNSRREIGNLLWKYECHASKLQKQMDSWEGMKPEHKLSVLTDFIETQGKIKALQWILKEGDGD